MLHLTPVICWRGLKEVQSILVEYNYAGSSYVTYLVELKYKTHTYSTGINENKKIIDDISCYSISDYHNNCPLTPNNLHYSGKYLHKTW
jgi:hypothetical protein